MKSKRYRMWRYFGGLLCSGLIGGLIGYNQDIFNAPWKISWNIPNWIYLVGILISHLIFAALAIYYLYLMRRSYKLSKREKDEDKSLDLEALSHKAYALANIWASLLSVPYVLALFELSYDFHQEQSDFLVILVFVFSSVLVIGANLQVRSAFKLLYGERIPAYANCKETQAFLLGQMDELEKQITFEESYNLVMKMLGIIFPLIYVGLILLAFVFQVDVMLTFIIVSIVYLYLIIGQYRITKRYYQ